MKKILLGFFILTCQIVKAQDTFSIVAVDTTTGEVGSAGASCVDLFLFPGFTNDFLGDLLPGIGAINTQASYHATNQDSAMGRMMAGDTPAQIINWLSLNDVSSNPQVRQYGIAAIIGGSAQTAGFTGTNCLDYKNHITGPNYCIQGNILLGQEVLDSMEARFNAEPGDLACKLMAALQGANMVGADTRCAPDGTSSLFAFVKVSQPTDPYGSPSLVVSVKTHDNDGIEPIDTLQTLFNIAHNCSSIGIEEPLLSDLQLVIYPNPGSQSISLHVNTNQPVEVSCSITDVDGRMVWEGKITSQKNLDISTWENGFYFVKIQSGTSTIIKKLIKQ